MKKYITDVEHGMGFFGSFKGVLDMADYFTKAAFTSEIPKEYLTDVELKLLDQIFDIHTGRDNRLSFTTTTFGQSPVTLSDFPEFVLTDEQKKSLSVDADGNVTDSFALVVKVFSDIIKRHPEQEEVVMVCSYDCSRMRLDGFGGSQTNIRAGKYAHLSLAGDHGFEDDDFIEVK